MLQYRSLSWPVSGVLGPQVRVIDWLPASYGEVWVWTLFIDWAWGSESNENTTKRMCIIKKLSKSIVHFCWLWQEPKKLQSLMSFCLILTYLILILKNVIETKFEYILPIWNKYLGGFVPETFSSRGLSCPTLNQLGYRDWVQKWCVLSP